MKYDFWLKNYWLWALELYTVIMAKDNTIYLFNGKRVAKGVLLGTSTCR